MPHDRFTSADRLRLAALTLVLLLPGTFAVSLFDRDEGWYAQVSREMLATGDLIVPRFLGEPWIAKPPLLYWCVAGTFALFGHHEFAARLVSVLAMTGVVQLLAALAAELYGRRAAWFATVSFITAALPLVVGRLVLTDGLLLLWTLAASVLLWQIATRGAGVLRCAGFWLCVGLAVLAKGPAVVLFLGGCALGLLWYRQERGWLRAPSLWATLPLAVLIAAPWYLAVAQQAGRTFAQQFIGYEIVSRLTSAPHGHTGPPGYYVLVGLAGWLPWTALVPAAVAEAWQARRTEPATRWLLVWLAVPWLALELIPSKLPHYLLPCYVPLAIMLGRLWHVGVERVLTRGQRCGVLIWVALPAAAGPALIAAAAYWRVAPWAVGVPGIMLAVGFVLVGTFAWRGRLMAAWRGAVTTIIAFHITLGLWTLPAFEPHRLSRHVAEQANALAAPGDVCLVTGYTEPTMFFYLDSTARVVPPTTLAAAAGPAVVVARDAELDAAGRAPGADWHCVRGFNYVKWEHVTIWVGRLQAAESPD